MTDISTSHNLVPNLCRLPVVLAVLLLTQLLVCVYVLSLQNIAEFDWQKLSLLSLYNQWISMLSIAGLCLLRHGINRMQLAISTVACLVWVGLVVVLANTAAQWISQAQQLARWSALWLVRDEIIYLVFAGIALRYLYVLQLWRQEQVATNSARLDALHARIRPHFLFNAMNTIAGLIGYSPEQAEEAVEDLSILMRANLSNRAMLSSWKQELELTEAYCRIEQQRLGSRLQLNWEVDSLPDSFQLPPLVLQPLLENAIYHGVEKIPEGGRVDIRSEILRNGKEQDVVISIDNPCPAESGSQQFGGTEKSGKHNGIAMENIRSRLASLYRDPETSELRASLLTEHKAGRYHVRLSIPLDFVF